MPIEVSGHVGRQIEGVGEAEKVADHRVGEEGAEEGQGQLARIDLGP